MDKTDIRDPADAQIARRHTAELHNDRSHDSTVDTDGKNREAARLAGAAPIAPDEVTTSNATLGNNVPETDDGLAGFDSRLAGNRPPLALKPGYTVIDKGMSSPSAMSAERLYSRNAQDPGGAPGGDPGELHRPLNSVRPARIIELRKKT